MRPEIILLAVPFFFLLILLELVYQKITGKKLYRLNDAITNLNIGIGQQAVNLMFKGLMLAGFVYVAENWSLMNIPFTWWSFMLCLLIWDGLFYWAHRWSHEINFWWAAHVVHHSSEEFNLSVALRQSWFHNFLAFFIFLPAPILGFPTEMILIVAGIHTLGQFWIHTKAIGKMHPIIEFIFNTPSHHRVHHGRNPKYIDKNHGGVFIFYDRIFGTFQEEEEEPVYGITQPLNSWNPAWANLHYYYDMVKAMGKMKWKDKFRMMFARPGWLPEYMGGYQAPPKVDREKVRKYDIRTTKALSRYVIFNFILISLGISALMFFFDELSTFYKVLLFANLMLSLMICGAIFENKRWVIFAEYLRLFLVLISLNALYYQAYMDWFRIMLAASIAGFIVMAVWFTLGWMRKPAKMKEQHNFH